MKKVQLFLVAVFALFTSTVTAQQLKGSGNKISKTVAYSNFDKVNISKLNGNVKIVLGKTFGITIEADDNLLEGIEVTQKNDVLLITQQLPKGWQWMEGSSITVTVTMPEISKLYNSSNANVTVDSFIGRYIGIINEGNGDVDVNGTIVDELDIENYGNGNVTTSNIPAKKVKITKKGNGDVSIKTDNSFITSTAGNGDIINYGKGKANIISKSGNGEIEYKH
jgi:hypothetical protein